MAYMVSSLAKFEYKDDTIVNAVLNSLETHPGRFDILDWENLLMASARLGTCPRRILAAVDALVCAFLCVFVCVCVFVHVYVYMYMYIKQRHPSMYPTTHTHIPPLFSLTAGPHGSCPAAPPHWGLGPVHVVDRIA